MPDDAVAFEPAEAFPLLRLFCSACRKWLDARDHWNAANGAGPEGVAVLAESLAAIVNHLGREIRQTIGGSSAERSEKLQYALVGLIDEKLVFESWPGSVVWSDTPLEWRLFQTRQAGERLPTSIAALIDQQDLLQRDVAAVYLVCLELGFRGRLRTQGGEAQALEWQHALHRLAFGEDSEISTLRRFVELPARVAPVRRAVRSVLPDLFRLSLISTLTIVALLLLSHLMWRDIAARVEPALGAYAETTTPSIADAPR